MTLDKQIREAIGVPGVGPVDGQPLTAAQKAVLEVLWSCRVLDGMATQVDPRRAADVIRAGMAVALQIPLDLTPAVVVDGTSTEVEAKRLALLDIVAEGGTV